MDRIQAMQVFRAVAEHASFSKAAVLLQMPRATVTSAVQKLEAGVGVRLLHRTTRRVSLTQEGELYLEQCAKVIGSLEEADALFSRERPGGLVRVDLPAKLARTAVIPRLPQFLARYPELRVRLSVTDRFVDPVAEAVDCVLRVGPLRDSRLVARKVGEMEQVNVGSPAYLERHGRPRTPADLKHHFAVGYVSSRSGRTLDWEYRQGGKDHVVRMRSLVSVDSTDAYQACCLAGLGLIQAPRSGMQPLLAQGLLEEVLPKWRPAPLPVSVIYAQSGRLPPRVRVFVDWLVEVLAAPSVP